MVRELDQERPPGPHQPQRQVDFFGAGWHGVRQAELAGAALAAQNAGLELVQGLPDPVRPHRMPARLQTAARMLQAAEGHVADYGAGAASLSRRGAGQ